MSHDTNFSGAVLLNLRDCRGKISCPCFKIDFSGRFPSAYLEALQQQLLSVTPDLFATGLSPTFSHSRSWGRGRRKANSKKGTTLRQIEKFRTSQVECPEVQQPQLIFCGDPSWWNVVSFLGRFSTHGMQ